MVRCISCYTCDQGCSTSCVGKPSVWEPCRRRLDTTWLRQAPAPACPTPSMLWRAAQRPRTHGSAKISASGVAALGWLVEEAQNIEDVFFGALRWNKWNQEYTEIRWVSISSNTFWKYLIGPVEIMSFSIMAYWLFSIVFCKLLPECISHAIPLYPH